MGSKQEVQLQRVRVDYRLVAACVRDDCFRGHGTTLQNPTQLTKLQQYRNKALFQINAAFTFLSMLYIPYAAFMPLYEGRRLVSIVMMLAGSAFFAFNCWLSTRNRAGLVLILLAIAITAGPTFAMLKLSIIMTTLWLVCVAGLIASFVERPSQAVSLASVAFIAICIAAMHLYDYVEADILNQELGRLTFATGLITALAFLTAASFQDIHRLFLHNKKLTNQALIKAQEQEQLAMVALQEAEMASEEKSRFLASMSHHLRTPLNAILGYAEILHEELDEDSEVIPDSVSHDTKSIQIASRHLLELIQDVLNLADIESDKLVMNPRSFDLLGLYHEIKTSMELSAKMRKNKIVIASSMEQNAVVLTHLDPVWMRQILFNLVSNAIKFTHDGQITMKLEHTEHHELLLTIQDTGIGLTKPELERIFEEFVQADENTLRQFGGTGLGLPLCHKLVQRMQGRLVLESIKGVGTWAKVYLPDSLVHVEDTEHV